MRFDKVIAIIIRVQFFDLTVYMQCVLKRMTKYSKISIDVLRKERS